MSVPKPSDFHLCSECHHPSDCLAMRRCSMDAAAFSATRKPEEVAAMASGIARALHETVAISNQLTATYAALRTAIMPLDAMLSAEQHARRDGEWQAFHDEHDLRNRGHNSMVVAGMHDAFNAGWTARKRTDYETVFGIDKPQQA